MISVAKPPSVEIEARATPKVTCVLTERLVRRLRDRGDLEGPDGLQEPLPVLLPPAAPPGAVVRLVILDAGQPAKPEIADAVDRVVGVVGADHRDHGRDDPRVAVGRERAGRPPDDRAVARLPTLE